MNDTQKPHIILVDDEPGVLHALSLLLGALGYPISAFSDPKKALSEGVPQATPNSVVLSDLRMPHLDGISLLKEIKTLNPTLPFILMSGHASQNEIKEALSSGASFFLAKPFTPDQLAAALKNVFQ